MNICKIRSYNAIRAKIFGKDLTMTQRIILVRSKPHTHNEFQFSKRYNNISFSATKAEGANCARFKNIKYSNEDKWWDTIMVFMTDEQEDKAYREAEELEGTLYDLLGQLSHVTGLKIWRPSKKKIWCTKTVGRLLYVSVPMFQVFLNNFDLVDELRPDQMDMMARYYFSRRIK